MDTLFLVLRVLVSLGAVLGALWFLQRKIGRSRARRKGAITLVARQSLGPKSSVAVIEVDGRRLILGVAEQGVSLLTESEAQPEPAPAPAFSDVLATTKTPARKGAATTPAPLPVPMSPLAGSIVSAQTWRHFFAFLKGAGKK